MAVKTIDLKKRYQEEIRAQLKEELKLENAKINKKWRKSLSIWDVVKLAKTLNWLKLSLNN